MAYTGGNFSFHDQRAMLMAVAASTLRGHSPPSTFRPMTPALHTLHAQLTSAQLSNVPEIASRINQLGYDSWDQLLAISITDFGFVIGQLSVSINDAQKLGTYWGQCAKKRAEVLQMRQDFEHHEENRANDERCGREEAASEAASSSRRSDVMPPPSKTPSTSGKTRGSPENVSRRAEDKSYVDFKDRPIQNLPESRRKASGGGKVVSSNASKTPPRSKKTGGHAHKKQQPAEIPCVDPKPDAQSHFDIIKNDGFTPCGEFMDVSNSNASFLKRCVRAKEVVDDSTVLAEWDGCWHIAKVMESFEGVWRIQREAVYSTASTTQQDRARDHKVT
jgi:hypothetical protein